MNSLSEPINKNEIYFNRLAVWGSVFVASLAVISLTIYFSVFNGSWGDNNQFGTFGDFLGGALNPLLGFLTVCLLIFSIKFQIDELKETRKELKQANYLSGESFKQQQISVEQQQKNAEQQQRTAELQLENTKIQEQIFNAQMVREDFTATKDRLDEIFSSKQDNGKLYNCSLREIFSDPKSNLSSLTNFTPRGLLFAKSTLTDLTKIVYDVGSCVLKATHYKIPSFRLVVIWDQLEYELFILEQFLSKLDIDGESDDVRFELGIPVNGLNLELKATRNRLKEYKEMDELNR